MKNDFLSYKKADFDGTNNQNLVFEMMGLCISNGTRIIVEQEEEVGLRYLMLDISPTDGSNIECDIYSMCGFVCVVTSIENGDEGKIDEAFTNYLEAFQWLVDFIGKGDFTEIYIETY